MNGAAHPAARVVEAWQPAAGAHPGRCVATIAVCGEHVARGVAWCERHADFVGMATAPAAPGVTCGSTWTAHGQVAS